MENRYKKFSYQITTDPDFMDRQNAMTSELKKEMEPLFMKVTSGNVSKKLIEKILKLIEKHPKNPQLKNYLSVAYSENGNKQKSREVNNWILSEHPDYLFGKLNQAATFYEDEEYEKMPEILGKEMEIQAMYPDRDVFHLAEVTGYYKFAILYFAAIDNLEAARSRLEIMEEIAPDHPDTEFAGIEILNKTMEKNLSLLEKEQESMILVKPAQNNLPLQTTELPVFENPVINRLYENDISIDHELIREILALPRQSLITDLEKVINDALCRFEFFDNMVEDEGWNEELMSFPIHAVFLLGEIRAEQSLEKVLDLFRQNSDFLELWFGDHITETLWEPVYYLGSNLLDKLKLFIQEPGLYTYAKSLVSNAVTQIPLHQPKRKEEVIHWYKDLFQFFIHSKIEDNVIDSELIGFLVSDVMEFNAVSLKGEIVKLFELGYVSASIAGGAKEVLKNLETPPQFDPKLELLNIFDRYQMITTSWAGYTNEEEEYTDDQIYDDYAEFPGMLPAPNKPKVGRNDPCPCGSGKKYKKCCLNKDRGINT